MSAFESLADIQNLMARPKG